MNKAFKNIALTFGITYAPLLLSAILVNGNDINTITTVENGGCIFFESLDKQIDNIIVTIKENNINVYWLSSNDCVFAQNPRDGFKNIQHNKKKFNKYTSNTLLFQSPNVSFEHSYLKAVEDIFLLSSCSIGLCDVLLETPAVFVKADKIEISNCFIQGGSLQLEPENKHSFISIIKITFKSNAQGLKSPRFW